MSGRIERKRAVGELLADRRDELLVIGLGSPVWDATALGDHPLNFPLWGGMGSAAMMGLGLALARPERRVIVLTGDGEMLMGLGSLATIAAKAPGNLAIAVLDNEVYGETGGQPTHTASGTSLAEVAAGAGFAKTIAAADLESLSRAVQMVRFEAGPVFAVIKVSEEASPLVMPPREGAALSGRFREALLGPATFKE